MEVGKCYFVKTPTSFYVGRVVGLGPNTVALESAAWVADTGGRLGDFLRNGKCPGMEVEYVGDWCERWEGFGPWRHALFTESV